jgi:hypothetical protein
MNMTLSDNDGEALNAIRRANDLLKKNDKTWEQIIVIKVVKKSFHDLSEAKIMEFLEAKMKSKNKKERIYATMFMTMPISWSTREEMDRLWELK